MNMSLMKCIYILKYELLCLLCVFFCNDWFSLKSMVPV